MWHTFTSLEDDDDDNAVADNVTMSGDEEKEMFAFHLEAIRYRQDTHPGLLNARAAFNDWFKGTRALDPKWSTYRIWAELMDKRTFDLLFPKKKQVHLQEERPCVYGTNQRIYLDFTAKRLQPRVRAGYVERTASRFRYHACCMQPEGSPGCWMQMDSRLPVGQYIPAQLWFQIQGVQTQLWKKLSEEWYGVLPDADVQARVEAFVRSNVQLGTAFQGKQVVWQETTKALADTSETIGELYVELASRLDADFDSAKLPMTRLWDGIVRVLSLLDDFNRPLEKFRPALGNTSVSELVGYAEAREQMRPDNRNFMPLAGSGRRIKTLMPKNPFSDRSDIESLIKAFGSRVPIALNNLLQEVEQLAVEETNVQQIIQAAKKISASIRNPYYVSQFDPSGMLNELDRQRNAVRQYKQKMNAALRKGQNGLAGFLTESFVFDSKTQRSAEAVLQSDVSFSKGAQQVNLAMVDVSVIEAEEQKLPEFALWRQDEAYRLFVKAAVPSAENRRLLAFLKASEKARKDKKAAAALALAAKKAAKAAKAAALTPVPSSTVTPVPATVTPSPTVTTTPATVVVVTTPPPSQVTTTVTAPPAAWNLDDFPVKKSLLSTARSFFGGGGSTSWDQAAAEKDRDTIAADASKIDLRKYLSTAYEARGVQQAYTYLLKGIQNTDNASITPVQRNMLRLAVVASRPVLKAAAPAPVTTVTAWDLRAMGWDAKNTTVSAKNIPKTVLDRISNNVAGNVALQQLLAASGAAVDASAGTLSIPVDVLVEPEREQAWVYALYGIANASAAPSADYLRNIAAAIQRARPLAVVSPPPSPITWDLRAEGWDKANATVKAVDIPALVLENLQQRIATVELRQLFESSGANFRNYADRKLQIPANVLDTPEQEQAWVYAMYAIANNSVDTSRIRQAIQEARPNLKSLRFFATNESAPLPVVKLAKPPRTLPAKPNDFLDGISDINIRYDGNTCPYDSVFIALFKYRNSWLEQQIRGATVLYPLKVPPEESIDELHDSIIQDIENVQRRGTPTGTEICKSVRLLSLWTGMNPKGTEDIAKTFFRTLLHLYGVYERYGYDVRSFSDPNIEIIALDAGKRMPLEQDNFSLMSCILFDPAVPHFTSLVRNVLDGSWYYYDSLRGQSNQPATVFKSPTGGVPNQVYDGVNNFRPDLYIYIRNNKVPDLAMLKNNYNLRLLNESPSAWNFVPDEELRYHLNHLQQRVDDDAGTTRIFLLRTLRNRKTK